MKKILFIALLLAGLNITSFAQTFPIDFCTGTWKYSNNVEDKDFFVTFKQDVFHIPEGFGGGTETCLVGAYIFKESGTTKLDCMNMLSNNYADIHKYPIYCLFIDTNTLSFCITDYGKKNGCGEGKKLGGGMVTIISRSPAKIKIDIKESEGVHVINDNNEIFPSGTTFPSEMILTKVTEL